MCRVELSLLFFLFHLSFFCLLFLFACVVVLPHYVVNKDEYIYVLSSVQCSPHARLWNCKNKPTQFPTGCRKRQLN